LKHAATVNSVGHIALMVALVEMEHIATRRVIAVVQRPFCELTKRQEQNDSGRYKSDALPGSSDSELPVPLWGCGPGPWPTFLWAAPLDM